MQIINLNTSTTLFISSINNQDVNTTFEPGEIISISLFSADETIDRACDNFLAGLAIFFTFISVIIITIIGKFFIGAFKGNLNLNLKDLIGIITALIITGIMFLAGLAIVNVFCTSIL